MRGKGKIRRNFFTIYRKTLLQMMLTVLLTFVVLGLVYYLLFTEGRLEQQQEQMLNSSEALAERVIGGLDEDHVRLISNSEKGYLGFAARSNHAIVWLINSEYDIIYYSSVPRSTAEKLDVGAYHFSLPEALRLQMEDTFEPHIVSDIYQPYLPEAEHWISASAPLPSPTGLYAGEIVMHYSLGEGNWRTHFIDPSIWISLLVAFIFATVMIILISRNITRPINRIVQTAKAVYSGDLSARVTAVNDDRVLMLTDQSETADDDLTLLIKTMNTLIDKWEKQEDERREFMSSISHDLRSPITSIKGFVGGMLDGTIPPERYDYYLKIVKQESDRLHQLIQTLFQITMWENPERIHRTVFDIRKLMHRIFSGFEMAGHDKRIVIESVIDPSLPEEIPVVADREAIYRVIDNIAVNALRYTPENGKIRWSVAPVDAKHIMITIEDSGPGIDEADRKHIFDRFYKADKSRGAEGSGLGLYIARSILSLHGQTIEYIDSDLGGAAFRFTLERP